MADLPKVSKNVNDLQKPTSKRLGYKALGSAVAAAAASLALGIQTATPARATIEPRAVAAPTVEGTESPAKLVFQRNDVRNLRLGQHDSHESHASHDSHSSHYSSSD